LNISALFVTYAKESKNSQKNLANMIKEKLENLSIQVKIEAVSNLMKINPVYQDLPYPDHGHRAAQQAWRKAGWN